MHQDNNGSWKRNDGIWSQDGNDSWTPIEQN